MQVFQIHLWFVRHEPWRGYPQTDRGSWDTNHGADNLRQIVVREIRTMARISSDRSWFV